MIESRHTDHTGVQCDDCDWEGQRCDCIHGYEVADLRLPEVDVEPCDRCPVCNSSNIEDIDDEGGMKARKEPVPA